MESSDVTYSFACVCNTNYIENTVVCLTSFFEHNQIPVDLYMVNSEKTHAFDKFDLIRVHYTYYAIDKQVYDFTKYRHCLEEIAFRFSLVDKMTTDYLVIFDTDTLFVDSISDAIKIYDTALNIVKPKFFKGVNAGFMIFKKNDKRLFDTFIRNILNGVRYNLLEEQFLYEMFENDITFIDSRYNYSEWMVDTDSSPVMYHFIGDFKPFRMFKKLVPQLFATKYFDVYYDFVDKHPNIVSDNFKNTLRLTKLYSTLINKVKERD